MKKFINLFTRKSRFTFYKRTLALVLAFVMLFNLSGEAFGAVLNATSLKNILSKKNVQIKQALGKMVVQGEGDEEEKIECKGNPEQRYECAYKNFAKIAQDYTEYIEALNMYETMSDFVPTPAIGKSLEELNEEYETNKEIFEERNENLSKKLDAYKEKYPQYAAWLVIKRQQEEANTREQEYLEYLEAEEKAALSEISDNRKNQINKIKKEYEEKKAEIRKNNEKTQEILKEGNESWRAYEEEWKAINKEKEELGKEEEKLNNLGKRYNNTLEWMKEQIEPYKKKYEEKRKALYGLTEAMSEEEEKAKIAAFGEKFERWKAEYEKQKEAYSKFLVKKYNDKAEKFGNALQNRAIANCESIGKEIKSLANPNTGDSLKDWERKRDAFSKEKDLHKACFGVPSLRMDDFKDDTLGFTYEEYLEIKYREYYHKYLKPDQKFTDKNGKKKYHIGGEYTEKYAKEEADEVAALFLLNINLGIEALGALSAEASAAAALYEDIGSLDLEIEENDNPNWSDEDIAEDLELISGLGDPSRGSISVAHWTDNMWEDYRRVHQAAHARDIKNALEGIDREKYKNTMKLIHFVYAIKRQAVSYVGDYITKFILKSNLSTDDIALSTLIKPFDEYKEKLDATKSLEVAIKQEQYNHFYTIDKVDTAIRALEKPRLSGLDYAFVAAPSTYVDLAERWWEYSKEFHQKLKTKGSKDPQFLKELLRVHILYYGERNADGNYIWAQVFEAAEKSKAKDLLRYMIDLANYVKDPALRSKLKAPANRALVHLESEYNLEKLIAMIAGFILDMVTVAIVAKGVQLFAKIIVKVNILRSMTSEQRMMLKTLEQIKNKNPEMYWKYINALENIDKLKNIKTLTPDGIEKLVKAQMEKLKFETELFKKMEKASTESWNKKYRALSKGFGQLSKDCEVLERFLAKYNPEEAGGLIKEIEEYNALQKEYNASLETLSKDKRWIKYNQEMDEYLMSLKVGKSENGEVVLQEGMKHPVKTKRIRQIEHKIAQKPELSAEARTYLDETNRATAAQERLNSFNKKLTENSVKGRGYTSKVKAKYTTQNALQNNNATGNYTERIPKGVRDISEELETWKKYRQLPTQKENLQKEIKALTNEIDELKNSNANPKRISRKENSLALKKEELKNVKKDIENIQKKIKNIKQNRPKTLDEFKTKNSITVEELSVKEKANLVAEAPSTEVTLSLDYYKTFDWAQKEGLIFKSEEAIDEFILKKSNGAFQNLEAFNQAYKNASSPLHNKAIAFYDKTAAFHVTNMEVVVGKIGNTDIVQPLHKFIANMCDGKNIPFNYGIKPAKNGKSFYVEKYHSHGMRVDELHTAIAEHKYMALVQKDKRELVFIFNKTRDGKYPISIFKRSDDRRVWQNITNYEVEPKLNGLGEQFIEYKNIGTGNYRQVVGPNNAKILYFNKTLNYPGNPRSVFCKDLERSLTIIRNGKKYNVRTYKFNPGEEYNYEAFDPEKVYGN